MLGSCGVFHFDVGSMVVVEQAFSSLYTLQSSLPAIGSENKPVRELSSSVVGPPLQYYYAAHGLDKLQFGLEKRSQVWP